MKKIIYSAIFALVGLSAVSCLQEHIEAVYDPSAVTAQVLSPMQGCELNEDGDPVKTTFSLADFGPNRASVYAFYAAVDEAFSSPAKLSATLTLLDGGENTVSVAQKDLNTFILNQGGEAGTEFTLFFRLVSYLANDKGTAIEGTAVNSNIINAKFIPYDVDLRDCDKYATAYLPGGYQAKGSGGSGWVFTDEQYLYDYAEDGNYTGLIDVYESGAAGLDYGFKLTLDPTWDNGDFGDNPDSPAASESETVNLKRKPGEEDTNILCYDTYRFYMFSFNPAAQTLTKKYAFNNVGIVGAFNGWAADDQAMKMTYNKYYHRFYIDYVFDSDTELKFTCDDKWDLNWGVDCKAGGDNIAVTAGSYRIYLDLNKSKYEFNTKMFGQIEPGAPEPEPEPEPTYEGWGITGSIASAGIEWDGDVAMTESGGIWTGYATLTTSDQFKFRKDAAWDENFGAPGDAEPYVITDGTEFEAVAGGKNMAVPADGFYKFVLDPTNCKITVSESTAWGVIGDFNDWAGDEFMTLTDGKWVSPEIALVAGEGFKIRKNSAWDENRGATGDTEPYVVTPGVAVEVVNGGKNLTVETDAKYIVTYDPEDETIVVTTALPENQWSLIGEIDGSNWDRDFYMTEVTTGIWMSDEVALSAGKGFKVRFNNDWGVNRGSIESAEPLAIGVALDATQDGSNLTVKEDGNYKVVYDANQELLYLLGWSLIGQIEGSNWDVDFPMFPQVSNDTTVWVSPTVKVDGQFKLRYAGGWDVNRGAEGDTEPYVAPASTPFKVVNNGKNLGINAENGSYYRIAYNETTDEASVVNASWSVIGEVNGASWDLDLPVYEAVPGTWMSEPFEVQGGFKLRFDRGWDINRGAAGDTEPYIVTTGIAVDVVNNGKNLGIDKPSGQYFITYISETEQLVVYPASLLE